jgi:hypothetical protein
MIDQPDAQQNPGDAGDDRVGFKERWKCHGRIVVANNRRCHISSAN